MAYDGSTWNEAIPDNDSVANTVDDHLQDVKKGVRSRMAIEHVWPAAQTGTAQAGQHTFLTLQYQAAKPTISTAQPGAVYIKSSADALFFERSDGTEIQVTTGTRVNTGAEVHPNITVVRSTGSASINTDTWGQILTLSGAITVAIASTPVELVFTGTIRADGATSYGRAEMLLDGTAVDWCYISADAIENRIAFQYLDSTLSATDHTFAVRWRASAGTLHVAGASAASAGGALTIIAKEIL